MKEQKGPEQQKIERSRVWSWNKTRDGLKSVERVHHKKGEEGSSAQRNGASKKEELCDDEEDKEPMIPTTPLKASPEALGVGKKAQKLASKWCSALRITGGALRPEKCWWYLVRFSLG